MPCGWVDISLSITSVGPSSFGFSMCRVKRGGFMNAISRIEYTAERFSARPGGRFLRRCCTTADHGPPSSALSQTAAAINHQYLPGQKLRVHQVRNGISNVRWLAGSPQGCNLNEVRLPLRRIARHRNRSRSNGIHPHFRSKFLGKAPRKHDDAGFRNTMWNVPRPAEDPANIREINDHPMTLLEKRRGRLRAEKRRRQIGVQGGVPGLFRRGFEFGVEKIGGVVDQDVQPPKLFFRLVEQPLNFRNVGKIRHDGKSAPTEFFDFSNRTDSFRAR